MQKYLIFFLFLGSFLFSQELTDIPNDAKKYFQDNSKEDEEEEKKKSRDAIPYERIIAYNLLELKNEKRALEYLQKSVDKYQDQKAMVNIIQIRARRGEINADSLLSELDESLIPEAIHQLAYAFLHYFQENSLKFNFERKFVEYFEILINQYPKTKWSQSAVLTYTNYLLLKEQYSTVLLYLTRFMESEEHKGKLWFQLAQIYDFSKQHRNIKKARRSYQFAMVYGDSHIKKKASLFLSELE